MLEIPKISTTPLAHEFGVLCIFNVGPAIQSGNDGDSMKIDLEKIKKFSAVSKEISLEMAKSVKKIFDSDYSVSTTGNAGPQNSDKISKKGGLFITVVTPSKIITKEYSLKDQRSKNIQNAEN